MKKYVLSALVAVLVIAFASTAMAARESKFEWQGNYSVYGYHLSNVGAIKHHVSENNNTDNFMYMKAKLKFRAYVSKTLWFTASLKGLDKVWGRNQHQDHNHTATSTSVPTPTATDDPNGPNPDVVDYDEITEGTTTPTITVNDSNKDEVEWVEAFITWISPVGYFKIGRYRTDPDPVGGKLGISPVGADRYFGQTDRRVDRIIWAGNFIIKSWTTILFYEKVSENDYDLDEDVDHDYDLYYMRQDIRWKSGLFRFITEWDRYGVSAGAYEVNGNKYVVSGDIMQQFGPILIGAYLRHDFGSLEYPMYPDASTEFQEGQHINGWAYYASVEYKQGPFWFGGAYYHVAGQKRDDDDRIKSNPAIGYKTYDDDISTCYSYGEHFNALFAAFGEYDGLVYAYDPATEADKQGLNMAYLWFDYNVIEGIWLHFAFGYLARDQVYDDVGKHYGTEYDLAVAFALAKGLDFTLRFGYFVPGNNIKDMYKRSGGDEDLVGAHVHAEGEFTLSF